MLFIIDGYNVTRRDPATRDLSLEVQREALVTRLRVRGTEILGAGRVVVVFDAAAAHGVANSSPAGVEVVYACSGSADDRIVDMAARTGGRVTVVSSDRELVARARSRSTHNIEALEASACFDTAGRQRSRKRRGGLPRDTGLPPGANDITAELKRLWVDEGEET